MLAIRCRGRARHWVYTSHKGSESDDAVARLGVDLRLLLVDLGPTFIKFGQMLSIRPDLLPASVLKELQKLCDAVPAFPTAEAIAVIESEFGRGAAARMFHGLDASTEPIAAASLGQVYRVHLRDGRKQGRGTQVAVKVQRPDMVSAVSLDLLLLRRYMHAVEAVKSALMSTGLLAQPAGPVLASPLFPCADRETSRWCLLFVLTRQGLKGEGGGGVL